MEAEGRQALPVGTRILKERCRCGHGLDHFWIRPQREWKGWSWLGIMAGVRMAPSRVDYRCGRCGEVLAALTDPGALKLLR
jgi:hypothetical protein